MAILLAATDSVRIRQSFTIQVMLWMQLMSNKPPQHGQDFLHFPSQDNPCSASTLLISAWAGAWSAPMPQPPQTWSSVQPKRIDDMPESLLLLVRVLVAACRRHQAVQAPPPCGRHRKVLAPDLVAAARDGLAGEGDVCIPLHPTHCHRVHECRNLNNAQQSGRSLAATVTTA